MKVAVCAIVVVASLGTPRAVAAVGTNVWLSEGAEEFLQGEIEDAVITSSGEIAPGSTLETVFRTGETHLWGIVEVPGAMVIATGTRGRLLRITNGVADTLRDSNEGLEIFALARQKDGRVIYGLSPEGLLLRESRSAAPDTLARLDAKYIWSILPRANGDLLVATGQPGCVWRIPSGRGEPVKFFECDEEHILALTALTDGRVYAGTGNRGLVYEIATGGNARVVFDAPQKEVKSLIVLPSGDLAIAAGGAPSGEGEGESAGTSGGGGEEAAKMPPAVYRLHRDGSAERLWRCPDDLILAMVLEPGGLLVATGNRGRVYRLQLDSQDLASLVATVEEPQVMSLLAGERASYLGTANPAVLYRLGSEPARRGVFTSRVFDAGQVSKWGTLRYDLASGTGRGLRFESRSGNLEDPDNGWSAWTAANTESGEGAIASPPARYLQWRVTVDGSSDRNMRLARVRIAFLPPNLAPRVLRLSVSPDASDMRTSSPGATPPQLHQMLPSGVEVQFSTREQARPGEDDDEAWAIAYRTAEWEAMDPNQDPLDYALYYRAEDEKAWHLLADEIAGAAYTWNTASFPDGLYRLKLVVSDSGANAPEAARSAERVSALFRVDHTAPEITRVEARRLDGGDVGLRAAARDAGGIARASYALDGGDWRDLTPEDGLFDETEEDFSATAGKRDAKDSREPAAEEHVIVIRVSDETGNQSVRRTSLSR